MDILSLVSAMKRYRFILLFGVLLGFTLLLLTRFTIQPDTGDVNFGPYVLEPRNQYVYQTYVDVMLDEPGFSIGKSINAEGGRDAFRRTVEMAPVYAHMATGDTILKQVERKIGPISGSINSEVLEENPIFRITAEGRNPREVTNAALVTAQTFIKYIETQQINSKIQPTDRIILKMLGEPAEPTASSSMSLLKSAIAFLSPIIASFLLMLVLENIERGKEEAIAGEFNTAETEVVRSEA